MDDDALLDSAFVKLKHAWGVWNARLFLVTTSVADSRKAHVLLPSSFYELRPYLTIGPSWDLADFGRSPEMIQASCRADAYATSGQLLLGLA